MMRPPLANARFSRGIPLAGLVACLCFLLLVPFSLWAREPTRDELREVEKLANHLIQRRFSQALVYFAPQLAAQWPAERLQSLRARMDESGGRLRHVQAARHLPAEGEAALVLVPVDFANGTLDLFFGWNGTLADATITEFRVRPRKEGGGSEGIADVGEMPFRDAGYVNRSLFEETPMQVGARTPALPALLTVPASNRMQRHPAVVLLGERWAADENAAIGPNRPMQDIAHGLASRGIVTLRFRPRLRVEEEMQRRPYTLEESMIADTEAALRLLAEHPAVDRRRLYVLGHELGAVAAAEIARRLPALQGVILLSPPESYNAALLLERLEVQNRHGLLPTEKQLQLLRGTLSGIQNRQFEPGYLYHDAPASFWYGAGNMRPMESLRKYQGHVLILFGERDFMTSETTVRRYADFVRSRDNFHGRLLSGLNHWFFPAQTSNPLDIQIPGHVDRSLIDTIVDFLRTAQQRQDR